MAEEQFNYPADSLGLDHVQRFNLMAHELFSVLGQGWERLEFDPERLRNPEYLGMARFLLADMLYMATHFSASKPIPGSESGQLAGILKANQVVNFRGVPKQLLYPDELKLITEKGLYFALPWSVQRAQSAEVPLKYTSISDALYGCLEDAARARVPIGIVGGCWDLIHGGHFNFFRYIALYLRDLGIGLNREGRFGVIAGVDENSLIGRNKGENKPYNDLSVRVGTLSEYPFITQLFRIPEIWMQKLSRTRYYLPIGLIPRGNLDRELTESDLRRIKADMMLEDPAWYKYVAPWVWHFWSALDPIADLRKRWSEVLGINYLEVPRFTSLSTTQIADDFGVVKSVNMPDRFGKDPWWISMHQDLARQII
ncbi:MAG TPA: hypothetical protein VJC17_01390 [Candidatus Dojkabacteria bacterium]|nr:hypothetical protein [Candidatus Dojkabacteria bacterium]